MLQLNQLDVDDSDEENHSTQQDILNKRAVPNQNANPPKLKAKGSTNGKKQGSSNKQAKSMEKKRSKSTTSIYANAHKAPNSSKQPNDWDSRDSEENTKGSSSMDPQLIQQLLSNFQNATTLNELRQELAASQASLRESRSILQGAAKSFFQGKG